MKLQNREVVSLETVDWKQFKKPKMGIFKNILTSTVSFLSIKSDKINIVWFKDKKRFLICD